MRKLFVALAAALLVTAGNAVTLRQFQPRDTAALAQSEEPTGEDKLPYGSGLRKVKQAKNRAQEGKQKKKSKKNSEVSENESESEYESEEEEPESEEE